MQRTDEPQHGDIYLACDEQGRWACALRFVRYDGESRRCGVFRDDEGETYSLPIDQLQPASMAIVREPDPDPIETAERRRYRQRSRITAQQRANRKLTDAQRRTLFALARRHGMDIDDLRAVTPQGSISKLTVREAGTLIDRLSPDKRTTGMGA